MKYVAEIDGLRAVAVLAVLLFHFGFESLPGGYAGVDIFFVISGYLITLIILQDIAADRFSFAHFYEKRMRRLFPALFATVAMSSVVGFILFMPDEFEEFGQSMISSTLYLSNVFFWLKSDYFSGPSELKPLLHTWSLSVEEQFYLVFPLLAWWSLKKSVHVFIVLVLSLLLISLVASLLLIESNPSAVFYLSPFRFWELLAGSVIASLIYLNKQPAEQWKPIMAYSGLALIILPLFLLDEQSQFPGLAALPSCVGTMLIIWAGSHKSFVASLLRHSVMRFIGKISYSLYLWHWPIVVFYGYWLIREFHFIDKIVMATLTFIIAWCSWRFLETPFRLKAESGYQPRRVYTLALVCSLVVFALGGAIWQKNGLPERFPGIDIEGIGQARHTGDQMPCFMSREEDFASWHADQCLLDSPQSEQTVLLWGDSHAFHLLSGLQANQDNLPFDVLLYTSAGCPPVLNQQLPGRPNCFKNNQHALKLIETHQIDKVILAGNWRFAEKVENLNIDGLSATVNTLKNMDVEVTVVNQLPLYPISNPQYLAARLSQRTQPDADYFMKPDEGFAIRQRIQEMLPETSVFDAYGLFCPHDSCKIFNQGNLMVIDRGHLSQAGSKFLVKHFLHHWRNPDQDSA